MYLLLEAISYVDLQHVVVNHSCSVAKCGLFYVALTIDASIAPTYLR